MESLRYHVESKHPELLAAFNKLTQASDKKLLDVAKRSPSEGVIDLSQRKIENKENEKLGGELMFNINGKMNLDERRSTVSATEKTKTEDTTTAIDSKLVDFAFGLNLKPKSKPG